MSRQIVLYIAQSIDGYIAKPNDDLAFLNIVHKDGEDYGYSQFLKTIDTVIIGRKTYDWIMTQVAVFPHLDLQTYVITRTAKPAIGNINFYTGSLNKLVAQLKTEPGKNIFIDGGAEIVNELLGQGLIDEMIISIIPILIGDGIRLFANGRPEQNVKLLACNYFEKGLVQLHYKCTTTKPISQ